jgi:hypothetical protein
MSTDPFVYLEFLRKALLPLPGVTEKLHFGTPAFYVNKKIFVRLKEDGETLVVSTVERDKWMDTDPSTFFITDHYQHYDYMLVALKTVSPDDLSLLLLAAWRNRAPTRLVKQFETELLSKQ